MSTLLERVAAAIIESERTKYPMQEFVARRYAQAALNACHAVALIAALRDLLEDTQHRDHDCGDSPENCPVLKARRLLARLSAD